jgi:hypothetical protein
MSTQLAFDRRQLFRLASAGVASAAAVSLLGGREASAGRAWCRTDPVVMIDGQLADVFVSSDLKMLTQATGPVKMRIYVPEGSQGLVVLTDVGFARGYDIDFIETSELTRRKGKTPVVVKVYAPAKDSSLPVSVNYAPRALGSSLKDILFGMTADGNANEWITLAP